jgi:hypothetical protein
MQAVLQAMLLRPVISRFGRKKMGSFLCQPTQQDLAFIKEFLGTSKVVLVIERCYPLGETAETLWYLEGGHAKAQLVITI